MNYRRNRHPPRRSSQGSKRRAGRRSRSAADVAPRGRCRPAVRDRGRGAGTVDRASSTTPGSSSGRRVSRTSTPRASIACSAPTSRRLSVRAQAVRRMSTKHGGAGGAIVNVSSRAAQLGAPGEYVDYAASKAALEALTVGLAREVAARGSASTACAPGLSIPISTPMAASLAASIDSARRCRCSAAATRSKSPARSCGCCPTRRRTRPGRSLTSQAADEERKAPLSPQTIASVGLCELGVPAVLFRQHDPIFDPIARVVGHLVRRRGDR